jgi:rare lipoprotein A
MRNLVALCAALFGMTGAAAAEERGLASYFHYSRHVGLTAAHRTLPIGSQIRVFNLDNGRSAVVTVVCRGPIKRGPVIDVSAEAADALGFRRGGVAHVRIESIGDNLQSASPGSG